MSIFDFFKRKRASGKQPDASKETSKQTSVANTIEPAGISNSAANGQEVVNIVKSQEVSTSSEQDSLNYSETCIISKSKNVNGDPIPNKVPHSLTTPVTKIGYHAFRDCKELFSVVIPDSVTEIGIDAFAGCSALTSVVIPDSVTDIGAGAFKGCSALTSVVIPNSVTRMGWRAFSGCTRLKAIDITKSVAEIDSTLFEKCTNLECFNVSPTSVP